MAANFSATFSKGYSPNPPENPLVDEKDAVFRLGLLRPVGIKAGFPLCCKSLGFIG